MITININKEILMKKLFLFSLIFFYTKMLHSMDVGQLIRQGSQQSEESTLDATIELAKLFYGLPSSPAEQKKVTAEIKHLILHKGADIHHYRLGVSNPLARAAISDNLELVDFLISRNIFSPDSLALIQAAKNNNTKMAALLVDAGIKVNLEDRGYSALQAAVFHNNLELIKMLLKAGAKNGGALIEAVKNNEPHIVKLLLEAGLNVNHADSKGKTALSYTRNHLSRNQTEIILLLLKYGANPNVIFIDDLYKETPLILSASWNRAEVLNALLHAKEINLNMQNKDGETALMLASKASHNSIIKSLLDAGADPNIQDATHGYTALHYAITNNSPHIDETVRLLLEGGANHLIKDKYERTALDEARRLKKNNIVDLFTKTQKIS